MSSRAASFSGRVPDPQDDREAQPIPLVWKIRKPAKRKVSQLVNWMLYDSDTHVECAQPRSECWPTEVRQRSDGPSQSTVKSSTPGIGPVHGDR